MSKRARIKNQVMSLLEQLAEYDRFPEEDPFKDGTVISFEKSFSQPRRRMVFDPSGYGGGYSDGIASATVIEKPKKYLYAAIRVNGEWYVTGNADKGHARSWEELVEWMGSGVEQIYYYKASKKERLL